MRTVRIIRLKNKGSESAGGSRLRGGLNDCRTCFTVPVFSAASPAEREHEGGRYSGGYHEIRNYLIEGPAFRL